MTTFLYFSEGSDDEIREFLKFVRLSNFEELREHTKKLELVWSDLTPKDFHYLIKHILRTIKIYYFECGNLFKITVDGIERIYTPICEDDLIDFLSIDLSMNELKLS